MSASGALEPLVAQVGEVAGKLRRHQHALVDDVRAEKLGSARSGTGRHLGHAADHVQLALERRGVGGELGRSADHHLAHPRLVLLRVRADVPVVDRDVTPGDHALALRLDRVGDQLLELSGARLVTGQEADADSVLARRRQLLGEDRPEERIGKLEQHPGAVAGVRVGAGGAAVLEVCEREERPLDRLVRRLTVQPRHARDAARVVLVRRVVEPHRLGRTPSHRANPRVPPLGVELVRRGGRRTEPASAVAGAKT